MLGPPNQNYSNHHRLCLYQQKRNRKMWREDQVAGDVFKEFFFLWWCSVELSEKREIVFSLYVCSTLSSRRHASTLVNLCFPCRRPDCNVVPLVFIWWLGFAYLLEYKHQHNIIYHGYNHHRSVTMRKQFSCETYEEKNSDIKASKCSLSCSHV